MPQGWTEADGTKWYFVERRISTRDTHLLIGTNAHKFRMLEHKFSVSVLLPEKSQLVRWTPIPIVMVGKRANVEAAVKAFDEVQRTRCEMRDVVSDTHLPKTDMIGRPVTAAIRQSLLLCGSLKEFFQSGDSRTPFDESSSHDKEQSAAPSSQSAGRSGRSEPTSPWDSRSPRDRSWHHDDGGEKRHKEQSNTSSQQQEQQQHSSSSARRTLVGTSTSSRTQPSAQVALGTSGADTMSSPTAGTEVLIQAQQMEKDRAMAQTQTQTQSQGQGQGVVASTSNTRIQPGSDAKAGGALHVTSATSLTSPNTVSATSVPSLATMNTPTSAKRAKSDQGAAVPPAKRHPLPPSASIVQTLEQMVEDPVSVDTLAAMTHHEELLLLPQGVEHVSAMQTKVMEGLAHVREQFRQGYAKEVALLAAAAEVLAGDDEELRQTLDERVQLNSKQIGLRWVAWLQQQRKQVMQPLLDLLIAPQ
eukprot:m.289025 g.289025  ORF g.289025 m.289025 type:complete len:473 (+) comp15806_c0_seq9:90-1508(+)